MRGGREQSCERSADLQAGAFRLRGFVTPIWRSALRPQVAIWLRPRIKPAAGAEIAAVAGGLLADAERRDGGFTAENPAAVIAQMVFDLTPQRLEFRRGHRVV